MPESLSTSRVVLQVPQNLYISQIFKWLKI